MSKHICFLVRHTDPRLRHFPTYVLLSMVQSWGLNTVLLAGAVE
jgi:hypothetical protein